MDMELKLDLDNCAGKFYVNLTQVRVIWVTSDEKMDPWGWPVGNPEAHFLN